MGDRGGHRPARLSELCRRADADPRRPGSVLPAEARFDLARQGYLNLLAGPQPANADTPAMIEARTRFLAAGVFDPIAAAAAALAGGAARVLDAGAGTGRLLAALLDADHGPGQRSRSGSRRVDRGGPPRRPGTPAARRGGRRRLAGPPVEGRRRRPGGEQLRSSQPGGVLPCAAPGGRLLTITPTSDHLAELRRAYGLLRHPADQGGPAGRRAWPNDSRRGTEPVHRRDRWAAEVVADAIAMGPNAFHQGSARAARQRRTSRCRSSFGCGDATRASRQIVGSRKRRRSAGPADEARGQAAPRRTGCGRAPHRARPPPAGPGAGRAGRCGRRRPPGSGRHRGWSTAGGR